VAAQVLKSLEMGDIHGACGRFRLADRGDPVGWICVRFGDYDVEFMALLVFAASDLGGSDVSCPSADRGVGGVLEAPCAG